MIHHRRVQWAKPLKRMLGSRFALLTFCCVTGLALAMGFALSALLTRAVSDWEWKNTAALIQQRLASEFDVDALFADSGQRDTQRWTDVVRQGVSALPEIVRIKIWDRRSTVIWADTPQLIGQRFPDNEELQIALAGTVAVEITEPNRREHVYEQAFDHVAEVYVPILSKTKGGSSASWKSTRCPPGCSPPSDRGRF